MVVVAKEHPVAAYDEIDVADLADEHLLQDPDTVPEWRDVATEVRRRQPLPGARDDRAPGRRERRRGRRDRVVPMSVARLHHRKDVVAVPVTGVPTTKVGLTWPVDARHRRRPVETFIGVVRGRRATSTRGR